MAVSVEIPEASESAELESKSFTVVLPASLAAKAEAMAEREGRGAGELIGNAFQEYYGDFVFRSLEEVRGYAATRNPRGYTEEDIPRRSKKYARNGTLKRLRRSLRWPLDHCDRYERLDIWITVWRAGELPSRALDQACERDVIAISDLEREIFRILVEKFRWSRGRVRAALEVALRRAVRVTPVAEVRLCRDPKDDMFLECAAEAKADMLVTGDSDLLALATYLTTRIVTPAQYVGLP